MSQSSPSNDYGNPPSRYDSATSGYESGYETGNSVYHTTNHPPSGYDSATSGYESGYETGNSGYRTAKHASPSAHLPYSQDVPPIQTHKANAQVPPQKTIKQHPTCSHPLDNQFRLILFLIILHKCVHRQPLNKPHIPTNRVIEYNSGSPPRTDVEMFEEDEEPRAFEPTGHSQRSCPKSAAESSLWEGSPFRPVPSRPVITRYDDAHMEPYPPTQHHETHVEASPPTQHVQLV